MPFHVYVVQYDNGGGPHGRLPYHWRLVFQHTRGHDRNGDYGDVFYVSGSQSLGYRIGFDHAHHYKASSRYRGRVLVGSVETKDMSIVAQQLESVAIPHRDPNWSDQTWVYAAVRRLHAQGFPGIPRLHFDALVEYLRTAQEAWERMED